MPFDSNPQTLTLADLSWRLRHPETWPKGFVWNYGSCSSCAMGLAMRLAGSELHDAFGDAWRPELITRTVRATIPALKTIKLRDFHRIFWDMEDRLLGTEAIAPEQVAEAIDAYLRSARNAI